MSRKRNIEGLSEDQIQEILASVPMTERSWKEMSMKPADHQFIVRLLNTWHAATKDDLRKFMKQLYLADNNTLVKSVVKEVKAVIAPLQKDIQLLTEEVKEVKEIVSCHDNRIQDLEKKVGQIGEDVEKLKKEIGDLKAA